MGLHYRVCCDNISLTEGRAKASLVDLLIKLGISGYAGVMLATNNDGDTCLVTVTWEV